MNRAALRRTFSALRSSDLLRRAPLLLALPGAILFAGTLSGCAKNPCLASSLPPSQQCQCPPKDDEILARLSTTELPYPVRSAVIRCADDIHRSDPHNIVTKQSLRECIKGSGLDAPTQAALDQAIQRSNLMEQNKLDDWHSSCLSGQPGSPTTTPTTPATPAAGGAAPAGGAATAGAAAGSGPATPATAPSGSGATPPR
jgi:hypothetical protein